MAVSLVRVVRQNCEKFTGGIPSKEYSRVNTTADITAIEIYFCFSNFNPVLTDSILNLETNRLKKVKKEER
jgi:hypothetical protein